jgi:membrane protease YdiL (CAAX protease family)
MGWLRLKSGSIWPTALAHAAHNSVVQLFFDHITATRTWTPYLIGEFGCGMVLVLLPMAWYCMRDLSRSRTAADVERATPNSLAQAS